VARKRTIDPDLWTNRKAMRLTRDALLFYIGTLSMADDEGRLGWSAVELRVKIMPGRDDVSVQSVEGWMAECATEGLVQLYSVGDGEYAWHPDWKQTQYVSRPSASKIPPPPASAGAAANHGTLTESHAVLTEDHAGLSEARVPSVSVSVPETETETVSESPLTPQGGAGRGDEDDVGEKAESAPSMPAVSPSPEPRGDGDPYRAAEWFFDAALKRGLIDNVFDVDPERQKWIRGQLPAAKDLIELSGVTVYRERSERFFATIESGELTRIEPNVRGLKKVWGLPCIRGGAIAGSSRQSDFANSIARRARQHVQTIPESERR